MSGYPKKKTCIKKKLPKYRSLAEAQSSEEYARWVEDKSLRPPRLSNKAQVPDYSSNDLFR